MDWKQFFTPVESLDAPQARQFLDKQPTGSVTLLDVRQPAEYERGHIPGAKLIPLPELSSRVGEIDPAKPAVVYCAIGGRSRIAAQMLAASNFSQVYNLNGGFKAWQGNVAVGPVDQGLALFSGRESAAEVLVIAYALEQGLREFYLQMAGQTRLEQIRTLFDKLATIEVHHQQRLLDEYRRITGTRADAGEFERNVVEPAMEGGLSAEDYIRRFHADLAQPAEVLDLAMSIEAQALDLYQRAADNRTDPKGREALGQIAREEQAHLKLLGDLYKQI